MMFSMDWRTPIHNFKFLLVPLAMTISQAIYASTAIINTMHYKRAIATDAYHTQLSQKITQALHYLRFRVNEREELNSPNPLAIVMAVDDTAIHTHQQQQRYITLVIPPTLALYRYAIRHQVSVFFVSERSESKRVITTQQLQHAGYDQWQQLYLKPLHSHQDTTHYKIAARRQIQSQGYDITENIGAHQRDVAGGYADMSYRLPQPYYS